MAIPSEPHLGVLILGDEDIPPAPPADKFYYPHWFPYPVMEQKVEGALSKEVVGGNQALTPLFVAAAKELEQAGAAAITVDCGFSIIYQQALCAAVSIPVITSSLLQLPLIAQMVGPEDRLGLLVYDKQQLTPFHLQCAGFKEGSARLGIVGIEGTATWKNWMTDITTTDLADLEQVTMNACDRLLEEYPDVSHILLECSGFPRFAPAIRKKTGRPVFDWVSLCNYVMSSAAPNKNN